MKKLLIPILITPLLMADCTSNQIQQAKRLWQESQSMQGTQQLEQLEEAMKSCLLPEIEIDFYIVNIEEQLKQDNLSLELLDSLENEASDIRSKNNSLFTGDIRTQNEYRVKNLIDKIVSIKSKIETNKEKLQQLQAYKEDKGTKHSFGSGERLLLPVLFSNGKATIRNSRNLKDLIRRVEATLREDRDAQFSITGYASSRGRALLNQRLSEKRARNLKIYIERYIPKGHIDSGGEGESDLICNSGYPISLGGGEYRCKGGTENEPSSRRVEIFRRR